MDGLQNGIGKNRPKGRGKSRSDRQAKWRSKGQTMSVAINKTSSEDCRARMVNASDVMGLER